MALRTTTSESGAGELAGFSRHAIGAPGDCFELFVHPTERFKTVSLRLFLRRPLGAAEAAANALLPCLWRRGCRDHPTMRELAGCLDDLYGAALDADVQKIGEEQILVVSMEVVADRFLPGTTDVLGRALELLGSVVLHPLERDGAFVEEIVTQEIANQVHALESAADDRSHHAVERCLQLMCAGEPFAVYELGTPAALDALDSVGLRRHHDLVLSTSPAALFVVGAVEPRHLLERVRKSLPLPRTEVRVPAPPIARAGAVRPRRIHESIGGAEREQGELVLGFRSEVVLGHPLAAALLVLDELLGGGPGSRLFSILREQQQLMYSISSFLVKSKGLLLVVTSCAPGVCATVEKTVCAELDRAARSALAPEELDSARRQVIAQLDAVADSPGRLISFALGRLVNGSALDAAGLAREVAGVGVAECAAAAATLSLDTVYYLGDGRTPPAGMAG